VSLGILDILALIATGAVAGALGGLVGIGGSIVMIPAMWLLFHREAWHSQHLYQAAAMIVNVAVAVPATIRHRRARAIRRDLLGPMLPATLVAIVLGVLLSNLLASDRLSLVFAAFLLYVGIDSLVRVVRGRHDFETSPERVPAPRAGLVGGVMGLVAGLLGVGGGAVAVPLAHAVCRVRFREAIAASAATMAFTAGVGAAIKVASLGEHGRHWTEPLALAAVLVPTALVGGYVGAGGAHRLPVPLIRTVFAIAMLLAAGRMSGVL
jgi:uncharacterized membrane protein YfcA